MLILSTCIFCRLKTNLEEKPHDKLPLSDSTVETVKSLHLQLGRERVQCTAQVIGQTSKFENAPPIAFKKTYTYNDYTMFS